MELNTYNKNIIDTITVDLSLNEPKKTDICNCIKARYDAGISNFKQDGTGVVIRYARDDTKKIT